MAQIILNHHIIIFSLEKLIFSEKKGEKYQFSSKFEDFLQFFADYSSHESPKISKVVGIDSARKNTLVQCIVIV